MNEHSRAYLKRYRKLVHQINNMDKFVAMNLFRESFQKWSLLSDQLYLNLPRDLADIQMRAEACLRYWDQRRRGDGHHTVTKPVEGNPPLSDKRDKRRAENPLSNNKGGLKCSREDNNNKYPHIETTVHQHRTPPKSPLQVVEEYNVYPYIMVDEQSHHTLKQIPMIFIYEEPSIERKAKMKFEKRTEERLNRMHYLHHTVNYVASTYRYFPTHLITFTEDDLKKVNLPHVDALVIKLQVENFQLSRVLVDKGSSPKLLFYDTFQAVGILEERLRAPTFPIPSFNNTKVVPMGAIELKVTAAKCTLIIDFVVIDSYSS
ncbi:uncharacterized protein LOC133779945 [Humulus lupulus]|uniref:uncharacterized protein LOC133779945 n=1 Tax=Humulus lupulus TaxID=3486 RepID=UPI002B40B7F7|nr:uncharacterized protein LOC133779945 [Humulus lupulus]